MEIDFFDVLDDEGWAPMLVDQTDPQHFWDEGGSLADAPVDMEATFAGAMWTSTNVDTSFNLAGLRCRPNFTIPMRHLNLRELIIVFGGEVEVEFIEGEQTEHRRVRAGEFWVTDAGTPFMMTAGPEGVTYVANWPEPVATLETYWHDRGWDAGNADSSGATR